MAGFFRRILDKLEAQRTPRRSKTGEKDTEAARRKKLVEQDLRRKQRGRTSLLTGGEGVTKAPRLRRKRLLGE